MIIVLHLYLKYSSPSLSNQLYDAKAIFNDDQLNLGVIMSSPADLTEHTQIHTHTQTLTHTHTHKRRHTRTRAHMRTHTQTHQQP